ncbi:MAG: hypothetical protein WA191_01185 [Telluria sp.]
MKTLSKVVRVSAMAVALAGLAQAALAEPVTASGGWVADFSPAMMETEKRSTTVFQLEGSYKLSTAGKGDAYLLITCVGMEAASKVSATETLTKGNGRCELKDKQGDKMLAAMETAFDGFTLTLDGGTGQWASARGSLVSKETFTVETERQLKGFSNMKGEIHFKK